MFASLLKFLLVAMVMTICSAGWSGSYSRTDVQCTPSITLDQCSKDCGDNIAISESNDKINYNPVKASGSSCTCVPLTFQLSNANSASYTLSTAVAADMTLSGNTITLVLKTPTNTCTQTYQQKTSTEAPTSSTGSSNGKSSSPQLTVNIVSVVSASVILLTMSFML